MLSLDDNNLRVIISFFLLLSLFFLEIFKIDYRWKVLAAAVISLEGLSIMFLANKVPWYIGFLVLLVSGSYLFKLLSYRSRNSEMPSLGNKFLFKLTLQGKLTKWFFPFGFLVAALDIIANKLFFNGIIGGSDTVVLISAFCWMSYKFVPSKFAYERDFAFLFTNFLVLILILPLFFYNINIFDLKSISNESGEDPLVTIFLAIPLSNLLEILGFDVFADGNILHFRLVDGSSSRVSIAQGCSGIYSVAIFVSAFFTYVLLEYGKFDLQVFMLLFVGLQMAYFANLIRMAIIIIVGHYYGLDALNWVHSNIGWLIFIIWIGFFWSIMISFLDKRRILADI